MLAFVPAFTLWLVYGVVPTPAEIAIIFTLVVSSGFAWMVVEPISDDGVLGAAGSYMAFLSGNISNMRLPCAMVAQEVTGVKPGTQRRAKLDGDDRHCGLDFVTNLIFVTLGAIGGTLLLGALPASVKDAFEIRARLDLRDHVHQLHAEAPRPGRLRRHLRAAHPGGGIDASIPLPLQMLLNVVLVVASRRP